MNAREIFEERGILYPCKNKAHEITIGRMLIHYRFAGEMWSSLTDDGILHDDLIRIGSMQTTDGTKAYCIILWRLSILIGYI